jgi:hypothetical protein
MSSETVQPWPPTSLQTAEAWADELAAEIGMIQAQLANKDHTDEDGRRLNGHEYHQWRGRAVWALQKKTIAKRRLNRWITEQKQAVAAIEDGVEAPKNVVELVGALAAALKDSIGWEDLTPHERALVNTANAWIRTKGVAILARAREQQPNGVAS